MKFTLGETRIEAENGPLIVDVAREESDAEKVHGVWTANDEGKRSYIPLWMLAMYDLWDPPSPQQQPTTGEEVTG